MALLRLVFRSIGEAVCAQGLRALVGAVPFGEVLYDVAYDAAQRFQGYRYQEQIPAALAEAVQANMEEVKQEAREVAREICQGQPPEIELRWSIT